MDYWVYENFPTNQATIHAADCGFCNNGQGKDLPGKSSHNGTWHGPFPTLDDALRASSQLKKPVRTHSCANDQKMIVIGRANAPYNTGPRLQPSNKQTVGEALETLRGPLSTYVHYTLKAKYADKWLDRIAPGDAVDVPRLCVTIISEWEDTYQFILPRHGKNLCHDVRKARNKWAHEFDIPYDDAYLALVAIQRLLETINSPAAALDVEKSKLDLMRGHVIGSPHQSSQRIREAPARPAYSAYKRFEVPPADESTLSLEDLFTRRLLQLYVILRDQGGYSAKRFLTSVRKNGGVKHVKTSLRKQVKDQKGFEILKQLDMLGQSMEAHVIDVQFQSLFTPSELAEARRRLTSAEN